MRNAKRREIYYLRETHSTEISNFSYLKLNKFSFNLELNFSSIIYYAGKWVRNK